MRYSFKEKAQMGTSPEHFFPTPHPTPAYVQVEDQLRANLERIAEVARRTNVEIILAFKAYALWKLFTIFKEYIHSTTASSLNEAYLGYYIMGSRTHTYAPIYQEATFGEVLRCSSHIVFNSLTQFHRFYPHVKAYHQHPISCGIRINPEHSEISTGLYDPASPGSRMGTTIDQIPVQLPEGIEGLHIHIHCENDSYTLERSLQVIEEKCHHLLQQAKWLNLGGGHLITHQEYNIEHLIQILQLLQERYPHLKIIMEPGSAFGWETGYLVASIEDIVCNNGIRTLMMDASFTCHMPDCLEMPYQPRVRGAEIQETATHQHKYRIGGNSCLSGDVMGDWYFDHEPKVGDLLIFEDMLHYTTVKTNMFNGIQHPSLYLEKSDGELLLLRKYTFEDYLTRMC